MNMWINIIVFILLIWHLYTYRKFTVGFWLLAYIKLKKLDLMYPILFLQVNNRKYIQLKKSIAYQKRYEYLSKNYVS